jgi:hypothetical protein
MVSGDGQYPVELNLLFNSPRGLFIQSGFRNQILVQEFAKIDLLRARLVIVPELPSQSLSGLARAELHGVEIGSFDTNVRD